MKEIKFRKINNIRLDEKHDVGVLEINGGEFVQCGGDVTARGIVSFIRPYDKVKENWHNEDYARSRRDVVFYMDNRAVLSCEKYERQLRHDLERQKW